ncbi:nitronate monooxygenase [Cytobacillus sp. IB215316]|uniref:NAD(P)H-dependent flavin oxidoreductase n=1 Tax=Cytobacillus sp. IB215316 TaxID=3097354 RepID=UPI002A183AB2|nr:nitronate monooxygenase [Cytobacillus sp. IB215316]MDX8360296.1 nitronate monooxygenase [Cytobacillus sp. IB215316]
MKLPNEISSKLKLPVIGAPMFLVSGPELVLAQCKAGIIGSFPAPNARTIDILDKWMATITMELSDYKTANPNKKVAPWAANLVVHSTYERLHQELQLIKTYKPQIVITALGNPAAVIEAVHSYGGKVFADVNSIKHAKKAASLNVDGLVLVSSGAGGHTGAISGFAFVQAVREFFDGILVLAGSISNGRAILASQVLGADLAYMGTRFISANESMATEDYKGMLVSSSCEDIICTDAFTGIPANMLAPSIKLAGLDPDKLAAKASVDFNNPQSDKKAWKDIWSSGHGVGSIKAVESVDTIVNNMYKEYVDAQNIISELSKR